MYLSGPKRRRQRYDNFYNVSAHAWDTFSLQCDLKFQDNIPISTILIQVSYFRFLFYFEHSVFLLFLFSNIIIINFSNFGPMKCYREISKFPAISMIRW